MKKNRIVNPQIVSALIWAFVMIACSIVLRGTEGTEAIFIILVGGATMQMLNLSKLGKTHLPEESNSCKAA